MYGIQNQYYSFQYYCTASFEKRVIEIDFKTLNFYAYMFSLANQRRKDNAEESLKLRTRQSSSGTRTSSSTSVATTPKAVTSSYCVLL